MVHPVSQLFPNGRWLLCRPDDYDVRYKINPWMDPSIVPEKQVAVKQWENLHHHLLRLGAWIDYVTHEDGLPDMVFTANAGLVRGRDVVISRFRHQERQARGRPVEPTCGVPGGRCRRAARQVPAGRPARALW